VNTQRLSARDYKSGSRRGSGTGLAQYKQFGAGLAVGLAVALFVFLQGKRAEPIVEEPIAQTIEPEVAAVNEPDPAAEYDFYDMLPKFEVVVPEAERNARRDQPTVAISKPGAYVLQVGSYRNRADAVRLRDRLAKQGIDASIQHVTIDENEWHRVRIGPSRDLKQINATREQLRAADVGFIVYEVGE